MFNTLSRLLRLCCSMLLLGGTHAYVATQLALVWPNSPQLLAGVLLSLAMCGSLHRFLPQYMRDWFVACLHAWLGIFFLLSSTMLILHGLSWLVPPLLPPLVRIPAVVTLTCCLALFAWWNANRPPRIRVQPLVLPNLPDGLEGFRLVQISDLHISSHIRKPFVANIVRTINDLCPDLVVLTGDIIDGRAAVLGDDLLPLKRLRARYGCYMVTGNHEYYSGIHEWLPLFAQADLKLLHNTHVTVGEAPDCLDVAGVNDLTGRHLGPEHAPDIAQALAKRDPTRPMILLAHQPAIVHQLAPFACDVLLCGHTHAGQIWPFNLLVRLAQPYVVGLHRRQGMLVYVHPGTGFWGPAMRLGTRAEITVHQLQR